MKILITGANRGLGIHLAKTALKRGHTVLAGVRTVQETSPINLLKAKYPDHLHTYYLDVTQEKSIIKAAELAAKDVGAIDGIINNAGVLTERGKKIEELDFKHVQFTMDVNVLGPMRVVKHFLPLIYEGEDKAIINISSEAGSIQNAYGGDFPYGISKAALNMFSVQLSRYVNEKNITVYAIHPGWIKTDMGGEDATGYPDESANGILDILEGKIVGTSELGFIDFKGREMKI
ncbi:short-chain dehydrogenase/reductase SDR [Niallia circulans]|uniref:SDR family oxidoreductase n=1 Tax=Niallia circulans TaxID=1397 RepID=UPI00077C717B|nr:SDR family oxidoreductase [Niallia circulans]MDR4317971.1 SDR family oxidoreductase [Niallia circulans]MED3839042.1 SDR family oxidoreductase [Niallia circulans]MED4242157.1 SDR family oxidoreductase [Niallia circulans]MED4250735.1 SDR family oxidoreductase [Niallia circulans]QKH60770.1 SDR family oxidoreductase [Niallia circulans]